MSPPILLPPFSSLTTVWHNESYSDIAPTRPGLSAGETVVVTGVGTGVGRATALSFARAGARKIKLLSCENSVNAVSVTDEEAMIDIAAAAGTWEVLILAAGYLSAPALLKEGPADEWWLDFERYTNVKRTMIASKSTRPGTLVAQRSLESSGYFASKIALIKVIEYIAAENPNVFSAAVHPNMVATDVLRRGQTRASFRLITGLPGDFMVWLTSPEGSFLTGRHAWADWDTKSSLLLTSGGYGWPYDQN
ncbi:hypothetical protein BJY04DRAFT_205966 [Aspergillus karnatakaensis]|uniref:uncharacterized protein n=1 Tax=Aspergillus karnatakaensis TaxID=1810916 RepID=UPI003CCD2C93